jgi:hypothetical protein
MRIAFHHAGKAAEKGNGWRDDAAIAITFSALAIEALANAVGDRVIADWKDFETASPYAKVRMLAEHLDVPYDARESLWASIRWLGQFRNRIAHAKPELIVDERIIDEHEYKSEHLAVPESKLEKWITVPNAKRAVEAIDRLKTLLCTKVPPERALGLYNDAWHGSTRRHS